MVGLRVDPSLKSRDEDRDAVAESAHRLRQKRPSMESGSCSPIS